MRLPLLSACALLTGLLGACTKREAPGAGAAVTIPPPPSSGAAPSVVADPPADARPFAAKAHACPLKADAGAVTVRAVDFCACSALSHHGTMRNCRAELHEYEQLGAPHDTLLTRVIDVAYGDLDGDGREEAAVAIQEVVHYARSGTHHESGRVEIFGVVGGAVTRLATLGVGPPIAIEVAGGFVTALVEDGDKRCAVRASLTGRGEPALRELSRRCADAAP